MSAEFQLAARSEDVAEGRGIPVMIDASRIAIFRWNGKLYATDEMCSHADASLAFGPLEEGCVVCVWHAAKFDLETGEPTSGPATRPIRTYPVRENERGEIEVAFD